MKRTLNFAKSNFVYTVFFGLLAVLAVLYPRYIKDYCSFVNWKTIATIVGLMITTTAIEQSAVLDAITIRMINRSGNELGLAVRLVALSVIFSAFLTNDISLFILVPITLHIQKYIKNDTGTLIVFEAIGVNVGSALTPIGNPQNIYLFHRWGLNFAGFIYKMLPMFLVLLVVLAVFVFFSFRKVPLSYGEKAENRKKNVPIFILSSVFIAMYLLFANFTFAIYWMLAIVVVAYFLFYRKVFRSLDWMLILLFCVMFVDLNVIARIPLVKNAVLSLNLSNAKTLFGASVLLSQIMSNVPASIFLSKYSANYRIIAYGVNVGGNGFIVASLANIIALKLSGKNLFYKFHKYSFAFLATTFSVILLLL